MRLVLLRSATFTVAAALVGGCLMESDASEFRVVDVSGVVVGRGPPYEGALAVCGMPYMDAGIDFDARELWVVHAPPVAEQDLRLVLVDRVMVHDPARRSDCGDWPDFSASASDRIEWSGSLHGHEHEAVVEVADGRVLVNGTQVPEGTGMAFRMDFSWHDPDMNHTYEYSGEVTFTNRGVWPAASVREAEEMGALAGESGCWRRG